MALHRLGAFALALAIVGLSAEPARAASSPTGQRCATSIKPSGSIAPSVASGYTWAVVATGLTSPRSLQFDRSGNLWVLEAGKGVSKHALNDGGGPCVSVANSTNVLSDPTLNHGMVLDGVDLYVSSSSQAYTVRFDAAQANILANSNRTLVVGMAGSDHTTRTLLKPSGANNSLIISRGSMENLDFAAANQASGLSTIKMFDLAKITNGQPFVHNSSGQLLGWGLRNSVGVAQHPTTGGLFAVENSVDQLMRDGTDIHEDNPGEEMNFLGFVGGVNASTGLGQNFGYPYCFTAWQPSALPDNSKLQVGSAFSPTSSNDSACGMTVAPRLTFAAHMAPLDMKFNNSATEAWISFHGSWDRTEPVGYGIAMVAFKPCGMPVEPRNSTTAANFILANADNSMCPDNCFRPAGIAFDRQGRLFFASDASGEVYVVAKQAAASNGTSGGNNGSGSESARTGSWWTIAVATAICLVAALI